MKTNKLLALLIIVVATVVIACEKNEDVTQPSIVINSPTAAQEFKKDSVIINFTINDEDIHEVGFTINRLSDDSLLYDYPMTHLHSNPYTYLDTLSIVVPDHTDAILTITAVDHNENESSAEVEFHIHPM
ncbi:MAG: hypothetical protein H6553_10715 [Chitinophagales bacterium]|nr:hypothetical protein [Chitinophagales bacterium]